MAKRNSTAPLDETMIEDIEPLGFQNEGEIEQPVLEGSPLPESQFDFSDSNSMPDLSFHSEDSDEEEQEGIETGCDPEIQFPAEKFDLDKLIKIDMNERNIL